MRLGCFGKTDQIAAIRSAGYDSAELDFCELTNMDENAFLSFYKEASAKVADIVRAFSQVLSEHGILLVVEPLGPANSNYLNTLPEVQDFLTKVDHPNCSSMCDLRHMHKTGEALSNISAYRDIVKHAHIDYPRGMERYFPASDDGYDYRPYFDALHQANYDKILTVEATAVRKDFSSEAAACCAFLRTMM